MPVYVLSSQELLINPWGLRLPLDDAVSFPLYGMRFQKLLPWEPLGNIHKKFIIETLFIQIASYSFNVKVLYKHELLATY